MANSGARSHTTHPSARVADASLPRACEATAYCPGCATFETVWFVNGHLIETRKFSEFGHSLYHGCGTAQPCRLYGVR